jgi:putative phosphoserine phosphatase / 1-acylglycerol-3-phosphate O-acyltransferase
MTTAEVVPPNQSPTRSPRALPGTVVEIERSPAGPSTGAFFDFDGTLIAGFSAGVFAGDRFRRREVGLGEMARMLRLSVETSVGAAGFPDLMRLSATSVRGRR